MRKEKDSRDGRSILTPFSGKKRRKNKCATSSPRKGGVSARLHLGDIKRGKMLVFAGAETREKTNFAAARKEEGYQPQLALVKNLRRKIVNSAKREGESGHFRCATKKKGRSLKLRKGKKKKKKEGR